MSEPLTWEQVEELAGRLRPSLHRYCARMTGSVIDGEDVLQESLLKAYLAIDRGTKVNNGESWLFHIAHNAALDFLRRRSKRMETAADEVLPDIADPSSPLDDREIVSTSLRTFMRLPVNQRAAVILMDVLGYTLSDIVDVLQASLPAVKSALHRGRMRLRSIASEGEDAANLQLDATTQLLLGQYIEHFNSRNFDAIKAMLAEEAHLDLVNKAQMHGKVEISRYFSNYSDNADWHMRPGFVEGRPAILVFETNDPYTVAYCVLVNWDGRSISRIRDFRYARYVTEGAVFTLG